MIIYDYICKLDQLSNDVARRKPYQNRTTIAYNDPLTYPIKIYIRIYPMRDVLKGSFHHPIDDDDTSTMGRCCNCQILWIAFVIITR